MDTATTLKIALAALTHDMGKFAQGGMTLSAEFVDGNQPVYQPSRKGIPSHRHALYTAAFVEEYADILPAVFNQPGWGEGEGMDSFINLAACHHKPETIMQQCITQADRLSSGIDRDSFTDDASVPFREYQSTRLLSVLEALSPDEEEQKEYETSSAYTSSYPLVPLSAASIFPQKKEKIEKVQAKAEYQRLFELFIEDLATLPHGNESHSLWAEHFDSLLSIYCSQIPAARVGKVVPDVSLYDHCRTTASLAVPLYIYHSETDTLNIQEIDNDSLEKFLLVSGDFYGIQNFIFAGGGEQQRLRAKLLRGRSFAVSLISELAAHSLCEALGLPFTAVFLNAAGKFHILAANTPATEEKIKIETLRLNQWLTTISYGQSSLGVTATPASPAQFSNGNFATLWDAHLQNMEKKKYQRLPVEQYGVVENFLGNFNTDLERPLCPFCGKRPSVPEAEKDIWIDTTGSSCAVCRDHIMLGANLVKGRNIAIFAGKPHAPGRELLLEPFYDRYHIRFYNDPPSTADGPLVKYWLLNVADNGTLPAGGSLRLINGYVPVFRKDDLQNNTLRQLLEKENTDEDPEKLIENQSPKTFNVIAAMAGNDNGGTEALGILKADVDNLGLLMSCGMADMRFTLSRMATLSRRLDQFFSLYLPFLLASEEDYRDIYTVFAGGDDLFLIGPWNRMAQLAIKLRRDWSRYVSGNDDENHLTFSAGISLHKTHVPVDKLADSSEDALKQAKDKGRNSITMFGETVSWPAFYRLMEKQDIMAGWVRDEYISKVMLYRFNTFIDMAGKEKLLMKRKKQIRLQDMECFKWPALFRYSLERNIRKKGPEKDQAMQEVAMMKEWLATYGSSLRIPLWSQLYEQR